MTCPNCGSENTYRDDRFDNPGRTCKDCGKWFSTRPRKS